MMDTKWSRDTHMHPRMHIRTLIHTLTHKHTLIHTHTHTDTYTHKRAAHSGLKLHEIYAFNSWTKNLFPMI